MRRRRPEQVSLTALPETGEYSRSPNLRTRDWSGSLPVERVALGRAINSLSKKKRIVVLLHDVKGYTHREVAARLGVTAGTSKSQLYKAHLALRGILSLSVATDAADRNN
jgi:DNA-directed RNA polymerase specialized sigma24 family protein